MLKKNTDNIQIDTAAFIFHCSDTLRDIIGYNPVLSFSDPKLYETVRQQYSLFCVKLNPLLFILHGSIAFHKNYYSYYSFSTTDVDINYFIEHLDNNSSLSDIKASYYYNTIIELLKKFRSRPQSIYDWLMHIHTLMEQKNIKESGTSIFYATYISYETYMTNYSYSSISNGLYDPFYFSVSMKKLLSCMQHAQPLLFDSEICYCLQNGVPIPPIVIF